jgi:tetratricopeptide (TPR) repeat protein
MRAALSYLIDTHRADEAARLVAALGWYWFLRGYWPEAGKWLTRVINLVPGPTSRLRARALFRGGALEIIRGNLAGRIELVEEALEICQDKGDNEGLAWCLNLLGQGMTFTSDDTVKGASYLTESIEIFHKLEDKWGVAWSTRYLGQIRELQDDAAQAIELQREALQWFEDLGDVWNVAHSLYLLGGTIRIYGELEEARTLYQESYSNCQLVEDNVIGAHALQGLGFVALDAHQYREAGEYLHEALEIMQRIGDENCASRVFDKLARIAQHNGDYDQAIKLQRQSLRGFLKINRKNQIAMNFLWLATLAKLSGLGRQVACLLGIAEAYQASSNVVLSPIETEEYEGLLTGFEELRGDENFERGYAEGFAMDRDEAIEFALGQ